MESKRIRNTFTGTAVFGLALLASCATDAPTRKGPVSTTRAEPTAEKVSAPVVKPREASVPAVVAKPKPKSAGMAMSQLAYPTGNASTSAILLEKSAPAEVTSGQVFDYTLTVTNLTAMPLENVTVKDKLPENFVVKSASPAMANAAAGGSVAEARWTLGVLQPHETREIVISGSAKGTGSLNSCSEVDYNTMLCMSVTAVQPSLKILAQAPQEVLLCEPVPVKYTVTNTGSGTANDVVIEGSLPAGLVTKSGQTSYTQKIGSLSAGQSREYVVEAEARKSGKYEAKAVAAASDDLRVESETVTTVVRQPVLKITHTGDETLFAGGKLAYEITVTNTGDGIARNTVVEDSIGEGLKFLSASEGGKVVGNRVNWRVGDLAPEASRKFTVAFQADRIGAATCMATAQAFCAEKVSAPVVTNIRGIPAVLLEVVDETDPVRTGDSETYIIRVTNQGTAPATNVKIACTLPKELQHVSTSGSTAATVDGASVVFAALARLEPGAEATWKLVARATGVGDTRFKVSMTSDQLTSPVEENESTYLYQ